MNILLLSPKSRAGIGLHLNIKKPIPALIDPRNFLKMVDCPVGGENGAIRDPLTTSAITGIWSVLICLNYLAKFRLPHGERQSH